MSVYSDQSAALATLIAGVSNTGTIHTYQRFNADWPKFLDQFKTSVAGVTQVRGGWVTLASSEPIRAAPYSFGTTMRTYTWELFLLLGLADATNTEATFLALMESIMNALDASSNLGLSNVIGGGVGPCSMSQYSLRQFGSVLCHTGSVLIPVQTVRTD